MKSSFEHKACKFGGSSLTWTDKTHSKWPREKMAQVENGPERKWPRKKLALRKTGPEKNWPNEKTAQLCFKGHGVTQNLFICYFGVPDQNMRFYAKYAKFLFFTQNGPAPF